MRWVVQQSEILDLRIVLWVLHLGQELEEVLPSERPQLSVVVLVWTPSLAPEYEF